MAIFINSTDICFTWECLLNNHNIEAVTDSAQTPYLV